MKDIETERSGSETLRENEDLFRTIFDSVNDAIFIHDLETGAILDVNRHMCEMYGFTREEALRLTVPDSSSGETPYREEDALNWMRKAAAGEPQIFEWHAKHKSGHLFWVEVNIKRATIGRNERLLVTVRDITARKKAEEALRESESRLRIILESIQTGILIVDPETYRIVYANPVALKWIGTPEDRVVGSVCWESICPVKNGQCPVNVLGRTLYNAERVLLTADGEKRSIIKTVTYVTLNGRKHLLESFIDVTERRQAEEALQKAATRYKLLFNGINDAIFVHGIEAGGLPGKFIEVNDVACQRLGYTREELLQMDPADIDAPEANAIVREMTQHLLRDGHAMWEGMHVRKDGGKIPVEISIRLFEVEGVPTVLSTSRDITERKHSEEENLKLQGQLRQAQKMEAVGTLAGGIAHDFNNILTALIGYGALLQMGLGKDNILRTYADQILSSSEKAAQLTQSLLAFSRKQAITLKPVKVNDVITRTEKLLKRLLTEDIVLDANLSPDDTTVLGDPTQIDQVLLNLATNARDAMPSGGTLAVETKRVEIDDEFIKAHGYGETGAYVLTSVSDTGIGMDDKTRDHIFEPFFTTKEVGKGTGLGLSTVYGIIKQHNGYINVYSEMGMGTTFHIYLPAVTAPAEEEQAAPSGIERGNETILVAEDNESVRTLIRTILTRYGYTTVEAIDGEDAIDKFNISGKIDLLIIDSVMPKKNGKEVYDEIRKTHPDVKALFTSGYTRDIILDKGIREEEFHFISKPLSPNGLLRKVREVLDGQIVSS